MTSYVGRMARSARADPILAGMAIGAGLGTAAAVISPQFGASIEAQTGLLAIGPFLGASIGVGVVAAGYGALNAWQYVSRKIRDLSYFS